jgi:HD-GYP domain-containing protein (c-di-GMP phosphodiesterase class II)
LGVFSDVAERFFESKTGTLPNLPVLSGPTLNDFLLSFSKAMDALEGKPMRSAMKVAVLAGSIAKLIELPRRDVAAVVYAALLHDIGLAVLVPKIYPHLPQGVTDKKLFQAHALLNARVMPFSVDGTISDDLFDLLHQHTETAQEFIQRIGMSSDVGDIIASHHELSDGSGYPRGIKGDLIPIGARVLAFADVVEGVLGQATQDAPGLLSRRMALDEFLDTKASGKFDPEVISVFKRMLNDNDDLLAQLCTLDVESMVCQLLPDRYSALDGYAIFRLALAMGNLSDNLMPEFKRGRSVKVADMAAQLAQALGIGQEQCGQLVIAGLVMDLGHLGTPSTVLFKTGLLTTEDKNIIYDHPRLTQEILKNIPGFENIGLWASEHHERINGQGYPGQRRGYEISVGGRILALADVFNALTSKRPYRPHAHDPMDAIPVIGQGRSTLYDNELVTQLRTIVLKSESPMRY